MTEEVLHYPYPKASDPSALEHVTKMGRVGSKGLSVGRSCRARFRELPFSGQMTPPWQPPEPTPPGGNSYAGSDPGNLENEDPGQVIDPRYEPKTESQQHQAFVPPPFEERKLGRNMRAVQRGGVRAVTHNNMQLDKDASEPLLTTNPPSNLVVDYLANTSSSPHTAQSHLSVQQTSHQTSPRSITSPQHPSQDLIEMLNRNQSLSISRFEEQQRMAEERKREEERKLGEQLRMQDRRAEVMKMEQERNHEDQMREQERRAEEIRRQREVEEMERLEREKEWRKREEIQKEREKREEEHRLEIKRKNQEEIEKQQREMKEQLEWERLRKERIAAEEQHQRDMQTKNDLLQEAFALSPPPPVSQDTYGFVNTAKPEKPTDQGSSLPFSPHSGSLNYGTETVSSSMTTQKTDAFHGKTEDYRLDKQETIDEVQDIDEEIEVEQATDSDDEFNHF